MRLTSTCAICSAKIDAHRGDTPAVLHRRLQTHLRSHSFAAMLQQEIRQDLDEVPEEARAFIIRDIYRHLLGTGEGTEFHLGPEDSEGVYSIEEALGGIGLYRLWGRVLRCAEDGCTCRGEPSPSLDADTQLAFDAAPEAAPPV